MTSNAEETQGTQIWIGDEDSPPDYVQVKEMVSFSAFDGQANEIDVTSLDSTAKEFRMGLQDFGQFSGEFNFLSGDPGQAAMRAAKASRDAKPFRVITALGNRFEFTGYVLSAPISGGVDAKMDGSFVIRITGPVDGPLAPLP